MRVAQGRDGVDAHVSLHAPMQVPSQWSAQGHDGISAHESTDGQYHYVLLVPSLVERLDIESFSDFQPNEQTLEGSFSAVSTPNFATKYSLESS